MRLRKGQPNASHLSWKNIKEMENFDLLLEVNNIMTYESGENKRAAPVERRMKRNMTREKETRPYCSSRTREATNLPSGGRNRSSLLG